MTAALAVYVHWPFCLSKCPYCDFNSVVAERVDQARWARALVAELEHFAAETAGRRVDSVFFGGGTPSLMLPRTIATVIGAIDRLWGFVEDPEITLEANPSTAESGRFQGYREARINRLSIGVQSLDDTALRFLGRLHTADEARAAIAMAADVFQNYSFDLIYALPGQAAADWRRALEAALPFAGPHLSAYQLTVEPGTPFHTDGIKEAGDDVAAALFEATGEMLDASGRQAYEVSNHARPGFESRHNLHVWRGGDYIGVGPGAHGRVSRDGRTDAVHQMRNPLRWLEVVERRGEATAGRLTLTPAERRDERILFGLRLAEGLPPALAATLSETKINELIEMGHLVRSGGWVRTTGSGRLCLNAVTSALLT